MNKLKLVAVIAVVLELFLVAGCSKKVAKVTPPAPPAAATPTATLSASPETIEQGQSTTLTWQTQNATDAEIAGLGTVSASGSRTVSPDSSINYTLTAKGPGGTDQATARVTVNAKQAAAPPPTMSDEELFEKNMRDIFFDYDKSGIRTDQSTPASGNASFLAQHPNMNVVISGHCDERGSVEYNLALGDSRANALKSFLQQQGVNADRIKTVSYGKEKPFCNDSNEQCWQENRRDHISLAR